MSGFESPNHTQTPNDLFDTHMMNMGESELKVVLAIIRKTLGFHKTRDTISLSQLEKLTGLSHPAVVSGVEKAIERGLVRRAGTGKRGATVYELVIGKQSELVNDFNQLTELTDSDESSKKSLPVSSKKSLHTKENNKTKRIKQNAPSGAKGSMFGFRTSPANAAYWTEHTAALNYLRAAIGIDASMCPLPTSASELTNVIGAHQDLHRAGLVSALAIANYVAWLQAKYANAPNGLHWSQIRGQISVYLSQQENQLPNGKPKVTAKDILGTTVIIK